MRYTVLCILVSILMGCGATPITSAPVDAPYQQITQKPLIKVAPFYPKDLLNRGIEGWVLIEVEVAEDGKVVSSKILEVSPESGFNEAALNAVNKWVYKPGSLGQETKTKALVEFLIAK